MNKKSRLEIRFILPINYDIGYYQWTITLGYNNTIQITTTHRYQSWRSAERAAKRTAKRFGLFLEE